MTRTIPVGGEKYLFIGGQEDGKYIETPGCMYHEVSVAELPPRAGASSWKPAPRVRYHKMPLVSDSSRTHVTFTYVYVIDGMSPAEALERFQCLKSAPK